MFFTINFCGSVPTTVASNTTILLTFLLSRSESFFFLNFIAVSSRSNETLIHLRIAFLNPVVFSSSFMTYCLFNISRPSSNVTSFLVGRHMSVDMSVFSSVSSVGIALSAINAAQLSNITRCVISSIFFWKYLP